MVSVVGEGGGGDAGFYLSTNISQNIHPRKLNLVLYVSYQRALSLKTLVIMDFHSWRFLVYGRGQKSYLESAFILAILDTFFL